MNERKVFGGERAGDNFDHDPNTVSEYDAMGTPTPTGWSPIFPPTNTGGVPIETREKQIESDR